MSNELKSEFIKLWKLKDVSSRGPLFEKLFCRLLFNQGLTVQLNSRAAKPRQTDVLAEHGGDTFVFEIKWLSRKVNIEAIAQIRDRLARTSRVAIGCICSVSGFSETLIKDVEARRSEYEILLFNSYEIYGLFTERIQLIDLIESKVNALRQDGIVWFYGQNPRNSPRRYVEMPVSYESFNVD